MARPNRQDDDGFVLVLAIIFLGVIALVLTSVIGISTTGVRSVSVGRENLAKRYAADAALKYAVQQLRVKSEACNANPNPLIPPTDFLTSNGGPFSTNTPTPTVTVTCSAGGTGTAYGAAGYTLITNDTSSNGISINGAASQTLPVRGPVFIASQPSSLPITVTDGDVWVDRNNGACPSQPSGLIVTAPFTYGCLNALPAPDITLPTMTLRARNGLASESTLSTSNCAVYLPGKYTSIDASNYDHVYFASGVYYFQNTDLVVTKGELFGGRPYAPSDILTTGTPCAIDPAPGAIPNSDVNGVGVKIILGGSSRLIADNPSGVIELYSRSAVDAATQAAEGTQGVSLMTVPANAPSGPPNNWVPSPQDYTTFRVGAANTTGNGGQTLSFASHGLVYAPTAYVRLRSDSSEVQLRGGLSAGRLDISTSANIGGFTLQVDGTRQARRLHVVVTASGPGTDKAATATADLTVNTSTGKAAITSWLSPL